MVATAAAAAASVVAVAAVAAVQQEKTCFYTSLLALKTKYAATAAPLSLPADTAAQ
jgi:hypothetical protein